MKSRWRPRNQLLDTTLCIYFVWPRWLLLFDFAQPEELATPHHVSAHVFPIKLGAVTVAFARITVLGYCLVSSTRSNETPSSRARSQWPR